MPLVLVTRFLRVKHSSLTYIVPIPSSGSSICLSESRITFPEEARAALQADIAKKVKSIPEGTLSEEWANANLSVPSEIRLGDNPLFEAYKKDRTVGKLN